MSNDLKEVKWKEFYIENIANIITGRNINKTERISGDIPYVSSTALNNGIGDIIGNKNRTLEANCLSVNSNGSVGYCFYHPYKALYSNDCKKLRLKRYSKYIALFVSNIITTQKNKYSYGYKISTSRLKKQKIMLPVNANDKPDYEFMEKYIKEREVKLKNQYKDYIQTKLKFLKERVKTNKRWKEFFIEDIFTNIQRGKRLIKNKQVSGNVPYVSSTSLNNGIDNFINNNIEVKIYENCLSLANSGSVGSCFFEPFKFIASDHVTHLKNNFSKYTYLFLACMLNRLSEKYNFNREINDRRIKREKIFLPINKSQKPDYEYMANYIQYLEQKKIIEYLDFIK